MNPPVRVPPKTKPNDAVYHWIYFTLAAIVLILSFLLEICPDGNRVAMPWVDLTLPETCTFKRVFGMGCPGCGLTRSFISLAHGQLAAAWAYNATGILFFLIVLGQLPYRGLQIWRIYTNRDQWRGGIVAVSTIWVLLTLLLTQWIFRCIIQLMA